MKKKVTLPGFITKWKPETKILALILICIFIFIGIMPNIFKTIHSIKDREFQIPFFNNSGSISNNNGQQETGKEIKIICEGNVTDEYTETINEIVLYGKGDKFKKVESTITIKALSDEGKEVVNNQKVFMDGLIKDYKKYNGFTVDSSYKKKVYKFHLISDYTNLDVTTINKEYETSGNVYLEFKVNQNIYSVQKYYETNQGMTCKKK